MSALPSRARAALTAIAIPIVAFAAALACAAIALFLTSASPLRAFTTMALGAWGSAGAVNTTLIFAVPLILTGLAANIAFRARLFNFGGEGQMIAGAVAAAAWGASAIVTLPWLVVPAALMTGALAGALLMVIPAALKTRHGVSEFVTTVLINAIVASLIAIPIIGTGTPIAAIWAAAQAAFPISGLVIGAGLTMAYGVPLGLIASCALFYVLQRTLWGFDIRAVGGDPAAARFAGIPYAATLMRVALISGALAGLGGALIVTGFAGPWSPATMHGLGYAGIAIAVLAGCSPLAVIPFAALAASLMAGAAAANQTLGTPAILADAILALALILTLVGRRMTTLRWSAVRSAEVAA